MNELQSGRRIFRMIGIIIASLIGIILLFIAFVWGCLTWNRYSKDREAQIMQKEVCDTIKTVKGKFEIIMYDFSPQELKRISFYLMGGHSVKKDTTINFKADPGREAQTIIMPFENFGINESIIVVIRDRSYILSGFSYKAGFKYGMLGPSGQCECEGGTYEKVNGVEAVAGWLVKKDGLVNYKMN